MPKFPFGSNRKNCKCNLFTQEAPKARNSFKGARANWTDLEMSVFVEGGKPEKPEKNPRSNNENQQQTQPT